MKRSEKWAPYARRGNLTVGKEANTSAEQVNAVFTNGMDRYTTDWWDYAG